MVVYIVCQSTRIVWVYFLPPPPLILQDSPCKPFQQSQQGIGLKEINLTANAGGPDRRNVPESARQAGHVPAGLRPVVCEEDRAVGTGVARVGEERNHLAVPVRHQASWRRRLPGGESLLSSNVNMYVQFFFFIFSIHSWCVWPIPWSLHRVLHCRHSTWTFWIY